MASNNYYQFVAFAIVAIVLPTVAMATDYVVGDDKGWNITVNYTQWAEGKVFHVGDNLVFQYKPPHNVIKVDGNGFKDCQPSKDLLNSGNDTIPLATPGKKWYICGVTGHCEQGQKLVINVESDGPSPAPPAPAPAPPAPAPATPAPAPHSNHSFKFFSSSIQIFIAALAVIAIIAI